MQKRDQNTSELIHPCVKSIVTFGATTSTITTTR
jgi:hypothetical protein